MKTALVLSGGGAKGAYQIGAWKALKKLKIDFDIVTGTSIGALNGALIVQDNYFKAVNLWKRIDFNLVYNEEISKQMKNSKDDLELFTIYLKNSLKGGIDVSNLQKFINNNINVDKILNSKKDFSIVTYNMSNLKPEVINKKKIQKDKLSDYLMASASVFPVFNPKVIDDKNFVDGGYFDNLPINPAIDLGANKVIAIDLNSIGLTEKPKKDIEIIHIKPSNKLSNFLVFDKEDSKRDMQLGYNDTMKKFDKLQGDYYSFYNNSFKRNKDKYYDDFIHNLKTFNKKKNNLIDNLLKDLSNNLIDKKDDPFLDGLEYLLHVYKYDEEYIYNPLKVNRLLKKDLNETRAMSGRTVAKHALDTKKEVRRRSLIKYMYKALNEEQDITHLSVIWTNEYLAALYMYTINKQKH